MAWVKDEEHTVHWQKCSLYFERRAEQCGITARRVQIRDGQSSDFLVEDQLRVDEQRQYSYRQMVKPHFRPECIEDLWLEVKP